MSKDIGKITPEYVKDRVRAALDGHPNLHDLASEVAKQFGRDHTRKERILRRSPHLAYGMDADQLGQASSRELAARELKELGIEVGDSDPVQLLDAHHAGRDYARAGGRPSGSMDGASSGTPTYLDKYLNGT